MVKKVVFSLICLVLLFPACNDTANVTVPSTVKEERDLSFLPKAQAYADFIYVVSDTLTWSSEVGTALQEDFSVPYSVMPKDEPSYKVKSIELNDLDNYMKRSQILFFLVDLDKDSKLRKYTLARYKNFFDQNKDFGFKTFVSEHLWANGQLIVFLVGENEKALMEGYTKKKAQLKKRVDHFKTEDAARRMRETQKHSTYVKEIKDNYYFDLHIPMNFRQGWKDNNFYWYVKDITKGYLGLVVYDADYEDSTAFNMMNVLKKRDVVMGQFITGHDSTKTMMTDHLEMVEEKVITLGGQYAKEFRGLWRLKDEFIGGPFVHYATYNPVSKRITYIDAFVMAPGEDKKAHLKELEAIVHTLKY